MNEIKEASRDFNEVETYLMTISPAIKSLKDVPDDTHIPVDGVMIFEDIKETTGEVTEVMSIITPDKDVYCCQSATFKRSIKDIMKIMGDKPFTVVKTSGVTKAGRDFINCTLDTKALM